MIRGRPVPGNLHYFKYERFMKRLLMVVYHFPPFVGSSGVHRALSFSSYLPNHGWEPIVLTAHPRAYERRSDELLAQVREGTRIIRAPAWDTKRHLSIAGRYPAFMARPDRWRLWSLGAVPAGLWAIGRYKPDVIWSTYPIATAHVIATTLKRLSGLPWIADFRDPMAQDGYPADAATRHSFNRIERRATTLARFSTFTTPGGVQLYQQRYPANSERMRLLENGYDDAAFDASTTSPGALNPNRLTLLHSGVVYPSERDPAQLFAALRDLRLRVPALFARLVLRFRAAEHEELLRELGNRYHVTEAIEIFPAVGHRAAVDEMLRADGLLILQANNCNAQIPAKFYEYLRARRPIVVADPPGDTAAAARAAGIDAIAALESAPAIAAILERFAIDPLAGTVATDRAIEGASRRGPDCGVGKTAG